MSPPSDVLVMHGTQLQYASHSCLSSVVVCLQGTIGDFPQCLGQFMLSQRQLNTLDEATLDFLIVQVSSSWQQVWPSNCLQSDEAQACLHLRLPCVAFWPASAPAGLGSSLWPIVSIRYACTISVCALTEGQRLMHFAVHSLTVLNASFSGLLREDLPAENHAYAAGQPAENTQLGHHPQVSQKLISCTPLHTTYMSVSCVAYQSVRLATKARAAPCAVHVRPEMLFRAAPRQWLSLLWTG